MATTTDYINSLKQDKTNLVNNLVEKGVEATEDETFTSLVPKVLDIQSGGTTVEKGVILNEFDAEGYVTKATVVGMSAVPSYYFKNQNGSAGFFKELEELDLSDGVTTLGSYSCQYCNYLRAVNFSNNFETIGSSAFYSCSRLVLTSLPLTLKSIGSSAFYGNSKIAIKEIPEGVTEIGNSTFYNCYGQDFNELTVKGDITSIGSSAFGSCSYLEKLVFPNVTSVPTLSNANAFSGTKIKYGTGYIYFPDTLVEEAKVATNWSTYVDQIKGVSEL